MGVGGPATHGSWPQLPLPIHQPSRYRSSIWVPLAASSRASLGEGAGLLETQRPLLTFPFLPSPPSRPPTPFQLPLPYSSWLRRVVTHAYRVVNRPLFRHSKPTPAFSSITPVPGLAAAETPAGWESPEPRRMLPALRPDALLPARPVRTHVGTRTPSPHLARSYFKMPTGPRPQPGPLAPASGFRAPHQRTQPPVPCTDPSARSQVPHGQGSPEPLGHRPGTLRCAEGCSVQVSPPRLH